jgi:prophage tail gpP-like protein
MPEAVAIELEDSGQRLGEWSDIELQFGLDTYSAASLSGPFDHERREVRRALQPMAFPRVTVSIGDELVITGKVTDVAPSVDAEQSSVGVTVYSLAHELTEICAPVSLLPLEFNGFDLKRIAQRLAAAAGLSVEFEAGAAPGARFVRCRCEPDQVVHSFLVELALQRGFVVADLPSGALLFRSEAPTGAPVARLKGQPLGRVNAQFNPGNWFSSITGRACQRAGKSSSSYTEPNPLYRGTIPRTFTASVGDTEAADVPKATKAMVGRMIASVVTYTVEDLPSWRDPSGELWRPNTTLTLEAPEAMIYRETELLIRTVTLRQSADVETATLELVLPGAFGGTLPTVLPWEE